MEPISGQAAYEVESGVFHDKHLLNPVGDSVMAGERLFVGVSLLDVKYPDLVVMIESVWATGTGVHFFRKVPTLIYSYCR